MKVLEIRFFKMNRIKIIYLKATNKNMTHGVEGTLCYGTSRLITFSAFWNMNSLKCVV